MKSGRAAATADHTLSRSAFLKKNRNEADRKTDDNDGPYDVAQTNVHTT